MTFPGMLRTPVALTDEAYHLLNEYLEEHFGLWFPGHRRQILESRLQERMRELFLTDFLDYHLLLQTGGADERSRLARAVTNNETYFFRETGQFDALIRHVVPGLRADRVGADPVRVLSAGCSSGEEAFTLRFWFDEAGAAARVDAFDLDADRVAMAGRGRYRERSVRDMTPAQIERYLERTEGGEYQVRSRFRRDLQFTVGNIVDASTFRRPWPYDVVYCRNVLIYFSDTSLRRAIRAFLEVLRPGGYLFLGHAESIIGMFPELETVRLGSCLAYRRVAR